MEKRCDLRMKHEEKTNEAAAVFQPDVLSQSRGVLQLTSVSKCNFKSFFFLCHVYFSFFQALNLNFPVIQTESYSAIFFHFLILVLNVPNGATVLTCINLYTSQTAVLVASSAHFLIWGSNNSSSLNESIIS